MEEITLNNNENKTEQEFLEMAKDCMERISNKNKEIDTYKLKIQDYELKLAEIYGCYRKLTKFINEIGEADNTIEFLIREIEYDLYSLVFNKQQKTNNVNFTFTINDIMEGMVD
tara:strand:- start:74 stop:415 length:342 start_codon:yes stop_codon:yes gene_type:complete